MRHLFLGFHQAASEGASLLSKQPEGCTPVHPLRGYPPPPLGNEMARNFGPARPRREADTTRDEAKLVRGWKSCSCPVPVLVPPPVRASGRRGATRVEAAWFPRGNFEQP